ncbi:hypothetical protein FHS19_005850 [Paenibacillus rhizosphaerae]|uniref:Uncharacterized protein n=1 Tax=Paenibacillus rhizosphaerae TaxID=297318 RepID=A0A839U034_9BACL|nr:hypothetical protein [Paenibacillus rhizosphaerae]MBB3131130.1 hypothetical protein [Paenibacillus rhizosphaerae]
MLSKIQQEALEQARKHGGKLVRWNDGGYWTYEGVLPKASGSTRWPDGEWRCTTNTIFALVRRGYMAMDDWHTCSVVQEEPPEQPGKMEL